MRIREMIINLSTCVITQILLVSTKGSDKKGVWRIWILMLGFHRLSYRKFHGRFALSHSCSVKLSITWELTLFKRKEKTGLLSPLFDSSSTKTLPKFPYGGSSLNRHPNWITNGRPVKFSTATRSLTPIEVSVSKWSDSNLVTDMVWRKCLVWTMWIIISSQLRFKLGREWNFALFKVMKWFRDTEKK